MSYSKPYGNLEKLTLVFFIILIPLFILGFNTKLLIFDFNFYESEFVKNGIYDKFEKDVVDGNSLLLISYFEEDKELDTTFFNEKEKAHLKDVKNLINIFLIVFYIVLFLFGFLILYLIYFRKYKVLLNSLIFGGGLTAVLLLIFVLLAKINFYFLFRNFHLLFFTNELWLLDPAVDNLISLFPQQFFYDFFMKVLSGSVFLGFVFMAVGFIIKYKFKY